MVPSPDFYVLHLHLCIPDHSMSPNFLAQKQWPLKKEIKKKKNPKETRKKKKSLWTFFNRKKKKHVRLHRHDSIKPANKEGNVLAANR